MHKVLTAAHQTLNPTGMRSARAEQTVKRGSVSVFDPCHCKQFPKCWMDKATRRQKKKKLRPVRFLIVLLVEKVNETMLRWFSYVTNARLTAALPSHSSHFLTSQAQRQDAGKTTTTTTTILHTRSVWMTEIIHYFLKLLCRCCVIFYYFVVWMQYYVIMAVTFGNKASTNLCLWIL